VEPQDDGHVLCVVRQMEVEAKVEAAHGLVYDVVFRENVVAGRLRVFGL
jgi:hypothetical protein